jgi:hypothetical protein
VEPGAHGSPQPAPPIAAITSRTCSRPAPQHTPTSKSPLHRDDRWPTTSTPTYVCLVRARAHASVRDERHPYADVETMGYLMVVTGIEIRYRQPAHYGQTVAVTAWIDRLGSRLTRFATRCAAATRCSPPAPASTSGSSARAAGPAAPRDPARALCPTRRSRRRRRSPRAERAAQPSVLVVKPR